MKADIAIIFGNITTTGSAVFATLNAADYRAWFGVLVGLAITAVPVYYKRKTARRELDEADARAELARLKLEDWRANREKK